MFHFIASSACILSGMLIVSPSAVHGQCTPAELAKLVAPSPGATDWFGYAVAVEGDIAAVGAWRDDNFVGTDAGSVYLFLRMGGVWMQAGTITPFDGGPGDHFGQTLAISSGRLIVGSPSNDNAAGADAGAAYVYRLVPNPPDMINADFEAKLIGSDTTGGDIFGIGIALTPDRAIVGAIQHDHSGMTDAGAAYIFLRSGTSWSEQAKLIVGDPQNNEYFGFGVALTNDTALVSAYYRDVEGFTDAGEVFAFSRSDATWTLKSRLTPCDSFQFSHFGSSVALSGSTAIIGAFNHQPNSRGAAYIFNNCGSTWIQDARLDPSGLGLFDNFGISVAIDGDRALVGAQRHDHSGGTSRGAAFMFIRSNDEWNEGPKLTASDAANGDEFGVSVAISNETALVGAWREDPSGVTDAGSAYVFDFPHVCDSDSDGVPDGIDVCPNNTPGLPIAPNGRPLRDCNNDCLVDGADVQCIVNELLGL